MQTIYIGMYINGDANSLQYILNESLQKKQKKITHI